MKRFSVLVLCAFGLAFNACEKHPASELPEAHGAGPAHAEEAKHEAATPHDAKTEAGAEHEEAPKFIPEKK